MKDRTKLQVVMLLFLCVFLEAVIVSAAIKPSGVYLGTSTATPYLTSTPVYIWNQPTSISPTVASIFVTQTSQAQLTQIAGTLTPESLAPDPFVTYSLPESSVETTLTPTPMTPKPTPTRLIVGEGRLLIGTDRYDKSDYWAIALGLVTTLALIAIGMVIFTKRH